MYTTEKAALPHEETVGDKRGSIEKGSGLSDWKDLADVESGGGSQPGE